MFFLVCAQLFFKLALWGNVRRLIGTQHSDLGSKAGLIFTITSYANTNNLRISTFFSSVAIFYPPDNTTIIQIPFLPDVGKMVYGSRLQFYTIKLSRRESTFVNIRMNMKVLALSTDLCEILSYFPKMTQVIFCRLDTSGVINKQHLTINL